MQEKQSDLEKDKDSEKKPNILLVEVLEDDIQDINIPYSLYAVYPKTSASKVRALYLQLSDFRKQMSDIYKKLEDLQSWKKEQGKD